MAEQAYAYVTLIPVAKGFKGALEKELSGVSGVGNTVGEQTGDGFAGGFSKKLGGLAVAAGGALAAIGVGKFVQEGVTAAEELNVKLREVVTLTGQTGTQADTTFTKFGGLVKDLSTEFGIAQSTLTTGLYNALSAGVPEENAMTFLQVASKAAIGGVTDVNTAVDGLTTVMNAFGLEVTDAGAVSDSLFTAVRGGKTTFEELSASLFNVGPAAAAAGVDFTEVNAAIATLTASGTPTSVATTQIRAALVGLQRPSKDLDAIFQDLGYENAQLAIESEGLKFALDAVKDASGGSNGALQTLLGSTEAVAAVNVLAGTGSEKFTAELLAQSEAAGATALAFEEVDKGRNSERLRIAFENLSTSLGTLLLPSIESIANFMTTTLIPVMQDRVLPAFVAISSWVKDNIPTIATFIGVVGGLTLAFNAVRIATTIWTTAQTILNAVLAANPLGLIIIAVAALAAGIVFLATKTTFFQDTWDAMTKFVKEQWEAFGTLFETIVNNVTGFFTTLVTNLKTSWEQTVKSIKEAWTGFKKFFEKIVNGIKSFFDGIVSKLKTAWANTITAFETAVNTFDKLFKGVWNGVTGFFKSVVNGYINIFESFFNFVIRGANGLIRALNKIRVDIPATPFSDAFTIGVNLPLLSELNLPRLAKGGFVDQPTTALIGEAGPEVVMPLDRFEKMVGLDGGQGKTLNYYAAPNQSLDSDMALFQAMRRAKVVANW